MVTHFLLVFSFCAPITDDTPKSTQLSTITLPVLSNRLNALAAKRPREVTDATRKHHDRTLLSAIDEATNGLQLKFTVKVTEVHWKDGIAEIYTTSEFAKLKQDKRPISLARYRPFSAPMTSADAVAINPNSRLTFTGNLIFNDGNIPFFTKYDGYHLYTVLHRKFQIGIYSTQHYRLTINDKIIADTLTNPPPKAPPEPPAP